jgi:hypothetical protein
MRLPLSIFLLLLLSKITSAQNIYGLISKDTAEVRNKKAKEIIEERRFYNSTGVEKKKYHFYYNENQQLNAEERINDTGQLTSKSTYEYDQQGRLVKHISFNAVTPVAFQIEYFSIYEYDEKGHLIKLTNLNSNNTVFTQALITNDSLGHPVVLKLYNGNGSLYGTETASYNLRENRVVHSVYNASEKLLSSSDFIYSIPAESYNPHTRSPTIRRETSLPLLGIGTKMINRIMNMKDNMTSFLIG